MKKYCDHRLDLVNKYEMSIKNYRTRPHIRQRKVQSESPPVMKASLLLNRRKSHTGLGTQEEGEPANIWTKAEIYNERRRKMRKRKRELRDEAERSPTS